MVKFKKDYSTIFMNKLYFTFKQGYSYMEDNGRIYDHSRLYWIELDEEDRMEYLELEG